MDDKQQDKYVKEHATGNIQEDDAALDGLLHDF